MSVKKLKVKEMVKIIRKKLSKSLKTSSNAEYERVDIVLSVLAMMFFQDPSMLKFQERLGKNNQLKNIKNLFLLEDVASSNQIRNILDKIDSELLLSLYQELARELQRSKKLVGFTWLKDHYLIPLDATQYYVSKSIKCDHCLITKHANGEVIYSHKVLQAAIVDPTQNIIIPLKPEEIRNEDGVKKQDCETNAGKRYLKSFRQTHPKLKSIILGDDIYSHEPMIKMLNKYRCSFILTAKPKSHKELYSFLESEKKEFEEMTVKVIKKVSRKTKLKHLKASGSNITELPAGLYEIIEVYHYRWYNGKAPINAKYKTFVNYFELNAYVEGSNINVFHGSWVTDLDINNNNIKDMVKAGRGRWKIENNQFLTTKKGGYDLEHNYGHGKKNLSFNFYILNVLAFLMHQIIQITNDDFNRLKKKEGSFSALYEYIRQVIRYFVFDEFEEIIVRAFGDYPDDS
jgi:hypothetical protein